MSADVRLSRYKLLHQLLLHFLIVIAQITYFRDVVCGHAHELELD